MAAASQASRAHLRNLILLGCGFFGVFLAFNATQSLQSSLNKEVGFVSVATLYAAFFLSTVPSAFIVDRIGAKACLVAGGITYVAYIAANLHPSYATLVPTAALLGLGAAIIWTAQGAVVTENAMSYAMLNGEESKSALGLFNGIFWGMFQFNSTVGSLTSALILKYAGDNAVKILFYTFIAVSATGCCVFVLLGKSRPDNGAGDDATRRLVDPTDAAADSMRAVKTVSFWDTIGMLRDGRMLRLLPIMFYSGLEIGYVTGNFTSDFVSTYLDTSDVGFVMAAFYFANALASMLFSRISDGIDRRILFLVGGLAHVAALVLLLCPFTCGGATTYVLLFSAAVVFGIGDAVWNTQIGALLGVYFPDDSPAAFANLKMWSSLGTAIVFFVGDHIAADSKIIALLVALVVGIAVYLTLPPAERSQKRRAAINN